MANSLPLNCLRSLWMPLTLKALFFAGKIQALVSATKEQRREYKSKFVDLDVEFARMRERLETMNMILDDIQVRNFIVLFFCKKTICN